jgi:signal transduction histidine kinase
MGKFTNGLLIFLAAYIVLIILLIWWLRTRIAKPLDILNDNMAKYAVGASVDSEYSGPGEFVGILEAFSQMSVRLKESEDRRRGLEEDKQKMLADIAHDLKTPVAVIQGYATALNDGTIPAAEQGKYIAMIQKRSVMLNDLINNFYEFSKLEHPDYSLNMCRTDICNYFRDYVADQYMELETEGFVMEVEIPEEHVFCKVDAEQLKRVYANIIGNTVKYNGSGTHILFALSLGEDVVRMTIADSGEGIPDDIAGTIFEPFVVGEKARNNKGSGLGLSIARRIMQAHGGDIELLTDDGYWKTKFVMTLPVDENG